MLETFYYARENPSSLMLPPAFKTIVNLIKIKSWCMKSVGMFFS